MDSITPAVALVTYGITRLAAVIHDLRKAGVPIASEVRKDAAGHKYAYYSLAS